MSVVATAEGRRPRFSLLESGNNPAQKQSKQGILVSIFLHAALIGLAVWATINAGIEREAKERAQKVVFVKPPAPKPATPEPPKPIEKPKPQPKQVHTAPKPAAPAPKVPSIKMPPAPVVIATEIPKIDLTTPVTQEPQIGASGARSGEKEGGTAKPGEGGSGNGDPNKTYSDFEVEEEARPGGGAPVYPSFLQQSGKEGEVQAQFIIGPNGRVEGGSIKILQSSHEAFAKAVKDYLNRAKYIPGKVGGKGVRQIVQQTFTFQIARN